MHLTSVILSVLYIALLDCTLAQPSKLCDPNDGITINKDVINFTKLNVELNGAKFTWQAIRGTQNLTIEHTNDLELSVTDDSELTIKVLDNSKSKSSAVLSSITFSVAWSSICFLVFSCRKHAIVLVLMCTLLVTYSIAVPECNEENGVHMLIPSSILEELCLDGECRPVLCPLSAYSEYSSIPSNNKRLFEDEFCNIQEPERWNEWIQYYFGPTSTQDYYGDIDGDGLVNILEYYGQDVFSGTFLDASDLDDNVTTSGSIRNKRQVIPIQDIGTNPLSPDSDGDLLQDGFELFYFLDPKKPDPIDGDYDKDLLDNLQEQILGLDPMNPDSDGDGVTDGAEVEAGGNPSNPGDKGEKQPSKQSANVRLTVGDHSGSHSEQYILNVGKISHQSPGFGIVGSGTYKFLPGSYPITLEHSGSNQAKPDYDYTAQLTKVSGDAKISIIDEFGMLGVHAESDPFYAAGKSATLVVEPDCPGDITDDECECSQLSTCVQCKANTKCAWDLGDKTCSKKPFWSWGTVSGKDKCSCEECQIWHDEEAKDTKWLEEVNRLFPCPCTAIAQNNELRAVESPVKWKVDPACTFNSKPKCATYHPGAFGCLRSEGSSPTGAGQQCCYSVGGTLLPPDHLGAGTPDKSAASFPWYDHYLDDVVTFEKCCQKCEIPSFCKLYIDVRKGDDSHCKK